MFRIELIKKSTLFITLLICFNLFYVRVPLSCGRSFRPYMIVSSFNWSLLLVVIFSELSHFFKIEGVHATSRFHVKLSEQLFLRLRVMVIWHLNFHGCDIIIWFPLSEIFAPVPSSIDFRTHPFNQFFWTKFVIIIYKLGYLFEAQFLHAILCKLGINLLVNLALKVKYLFVLTILTCLFWCKTLFNSIKEIFIVFIKLCILNPRSIKCVFMDLTMLFVLIKAVKLFLALIIWKRLPIITRKLINHLTLRADLRLRNFLHFYLW